MWTLEVAKTQDQREKSPVKEQYKATPSIFLLERTGYMGQNASFSDVFAVKCGSPIPHVRKSGLICVAFLMQGNKHLKLRQVGVLIRWDLRKPFSRSDT